MELVFQAGDERQCVEIVILDDNLLEPIPECFFVDLVSNVSSVDVNTTKIFISDDEGGNDLLHVMLSMLPIYIDK